MRASYLEKEKSFLKTLKSTIHNLQSFSIRTKNQKNFKKVAFPFNRDLLLINKWAFQWKMSFNPDPNKQAAEVIFSHKKYPPMQPSVFFNNSPVVSVSSQKHLGLILDTRLSFVNHLNEKISKANKGIGLIKKLYNNLPRKSLLSIYKSFIRPHLDYADVIYDSAQNNSRSTVIDRRKVTVDRQELLNSVQLDRRNQGDIFKNIEEFKILLLDISNIYY